MSQESLKYNGIQNLSKIGVVVGQKICKTLQGSVYHGKLNHKKENVSIDVVIKRATIKLLKNKLAKINKNFMIPVSENIIKEAQIMKYIESLNPPNGFLKVHATLNDDYNYFLIMEYGGKSLLNHVRKYHKLIELNKLSVSEWKNHVKILFKQLVNMIYFLHNKARICHMDISLENILIKGCVFNSGTFTTHGQGIFILQYGSIILNRNINKIYKYIQYPFVILVWRNILMLKTKILCLQNMLAKLYTNHRSYFQENQCLMPGKMIFGALGFVYLCYKLDFNP